MVSKCPIFTALYNGNSGRMIDSGGKNMWKRCMMINESFPLRD